MAITVQPDNVRNYTIGSPLQPGKLVVLNGQMDVYDTNSFQTISNGSVLFGSLAYATDTSLIQNIGLSEVGIAGLIAIPYTIPASSGRRLRITTKTWWQPSTIASGWAALQIHIYDENFHVVSQTQQQATFVNNVTQSFITQDVILNPLPGNHKVSVFAQQVNSGAVATINNSVNGFGFVLVELV